MTNDELEEAVALSEADRDELEAAVAARDAEIAELKARLLRHEPPAPVATLGGVFVMPTPTQLTMLLKLVLARYPVLRPTGIDPDELQVDFVKAFGFVTSLHRLPAGEVDGTRYLSFWSDRCREALRSDIGGVFPIVQAVIASGDVAYTSVDRFPHSISLGLMVGTKEGSRPASNGWLRVLQGEFRTPIALPDYADRTIGIQTRTGVLN